MTQSSFELDQSCIAYQPFNHTKQLIHQHIHIVGFCFDGTACFRKGAVKGPDAIRQVSGDIETYSPYLNKDTEEIKAIDLGNLSFNRSQKPEEDWKHSCEHFSYLTRDVNLKKDGIKFITLGGEHSISYAPLSLYLKQYPDLVILHLDAHADLRDGYEGYHYSHASIIRRCLDLMTNEQQLIQYGIRSGTKEEYQEMKSMKSLCLSLSNFLEKVENIPSTTPIYLTLDLDYFDPSFLPGTGTPEAGGEDFHSFIRIMKVLTKKKFVGADIVELAPDIDPTNNSSVFATKVVREILLAMQ